MRRLLPITASLLEKLMLVVIDMCRLFLEIYATMENEKKIMRIWTATLYIFYVDGDDFYTVSFHKHAPYNCKFGHMAN